MEYIVSLNTQTSNFLLALGFGLLVGILYDTLRTIRLIVSSSEKSVYVTDFLFVICAAVATFLFCLTVSDGEIRWYIIFGEIIGFAVYYFTFGIIIMRFTDRVVAFSKKLSKKVFLLISSPFLRVYKFFRRILSDFVEKIQKKARKSAKKSKFHLQTDKALLYNLIDRMRLFCKKANRTKEK